MSLRFKINLLIFLVFFISSTLIALLSAHTQKELLTKNINDQANSVVSLISQDAVKLLIMDSPQVASELKMKLENLAELESIEFINNDKQTFYKLENNPTSASSIKITSPLSFDNNVLGKIDLYFSGQKIERLQTELYLYLIEALIFSTVMAFLIAWLLDNFYSKRITKLSDALRQTSENKKFDIYIKEDSHDEIGQAFKHFNALISETAELTHSLRYQINHDPLTALYSRAFITAKIDEFISHNPNHKTRALCFLSLDKFKIINDSAGHEIGDKFMVEASKILVEQLQDTPNSWLGRAGGDEFFLLIELEDEQSFAQLLEQLIDSIKKFALYENSQQLKAGLSIGAILFKDTIQNRHALLSAADSACNEAKHHGGNRATTYWINSHHFESERKDVQWVHRIRKAIKEETLLTYLQPIVSCTNKHSLAYEALVRLHEESDNENIITPFLFIPTLEKYGLMHEIDLYMIDQVIKKLSIQKAWSEKIEHIAINPSARTLSLPDLHTFILDSLHKYHVSGDKICFEITETAALANLSQAQDFIRSLNSKGCKFSLDDFGTGMASFEYLYNLPVDYLKIDGSFIKDINQDPIKEEMVRAMQKIAKLMQLQTVAEFVENKEIVDKLDEIGIDHHQGYYYSPPKPFADFIEL